MSSDVIIIGAGVAGLSCAKALVDCGKTVRILERSRGVGGRCATRRVDSQSVDHGLVFIHGDEPEFRNVLREVPGQWFEHWPEVIWGVGAPCQPNAFAHGNFRMAHANGVSSFPKYLATGLDIVLETNVTAVELVSNGMIVHANTRGKTTSFLSPTVVLALACPQTIPLLSGAFQSEVIGSTVALLSMMQSVPCATVIALYPLEVALLPWDIWYPEMSSSLSLICHDSKKRDNPAYLTLVMQARPAWSKGVRSMAEEEWGKRLLADAAEVVGPWVERPTTFQTQYWEYARPSPGAQLSSPILVDLKGGRHLGIVGELFALGGGVQGAWYSGRRLAQRLLEEVKG
jgi:predicted NAD/FAD-dependent oxidoreductase